MRLDIRLPSFLIIGAQKAGTTSLHHYCRQHTDIIMAHVKEPIFFSSTKSPETTWEARSAKNPYPFFYLEEYAE
ncbi:MAG TPA: hypothetical protein VFY26_13525 [Anaerolineales bacterium]|nr:hypothetical protein [Anaerolineales bacterium]